MEPRPLHESASAPTGTGGDVRPDRARWTRFRWVARVLPDQGLAMEARLFQLVSLLATLLAFLVIIPFNVLQNLSPWLNIAVFVFGVSTLWFWWEARRGRRRPVAMFAVFVTVLNITWFVNGGAQGSIVLYFFDAALLPVIFCGRRVRAALLAALVLDVVVLYWLDFALPHWIVPFETPADRYIDSATGFAICVCALAITVAVVLESYQREHARLAEANERLQQSLEEVRTLRGLLPICSWCRKVRDDEGLWTQIEQYVSQRTEAAFTHGMCPECSTRFRAEFGIDPTGVTEPTRKSAP